MPMRYEVLFEIEQEEVEAGQLPTVKTDTDSVVNVMSQELET